MSEDASKTETAEAKAQGRRFWLTVGEVVALLGLGLGGLSYWDSHRERVQTEAEAARAEAKAEQAQKRSVFLMRGEADKKGERVLLNPTDAGQLVQTQRYLFPAAVLGHAKEIGAGQLQIDLVWFEDGLGEVLKAARKAGGALPEGEAALPVGVVTTYVENGESRTDQSLYRVGYVAESGLLGAVKLRLVGASLVRRGVTGDLQAAVERAWAAEAPGGAAP